MTARPRVVVDGGDDLAVLQGDGLVPGLRANVTHPLGRRPPVIGAIMGG